MGDRRGGPPSARGRRGLPPTLRWVGDERGYLEMLDQTRLPAIERSLRIRDDQALWAAIRRLSVRGAPAIGVAAAYGFVLGARRSRATTPGAFRRAALRRADFLATSRPTAVNLFWALDRMRAALERALSAAPPGRGRSRARPGFSRAAALRALLEEARRIHKEDAALCEAIGSHGAKLLPADGAVLTHCNAGALATGGVGTALAVVYCAARAGKRVRVFADETRPLLQGARLTAWELSRSGIPVTVLCDGAAGVVLREGKVDCVVVGADRIARNGDVANKVGTYSVAVLARESGVPFYVAAPSTTFDLALASGAEIPIEERSADEVTRGFGRLTAPRGIPAFNPAFDVTPARLISGIITEVGVLRPPYRRSIRARLGP